MPACLPGCCRWTPQKAYRALRLSNVRTAWRARGLSPGSALAGVSGIGSPEVAALGGGEF
jgi:hypothetical protein